jgi:hypothetical protein
MTGRAFEDGQDLLPTGARRHRLYLTLLLSAWTVSPKPLSSGQAIADFACSPESHCAWLDGSSLRLALEGKRFHPDRQSSAGKIGGKTQPK